MDPEIQFRVDQLRDQINYHNHRYHVLDSPEIADGQYDELMQKLSRLEQEYPEMVTPGSPTQRVGASPISELPEVGHSVPMLSLANAFNQEEFITWHRRVLRLLEVDQVDMVCELKVDGLSMALVYQDSQLIQGSTRGNGYKGEDVTHSTRTIKSIPLALMRKASTRLEVRGEVYLPQRDFERINEGRVAEGLPPYANPRNTAAGTVRQLDPKTIASRNLDIIVWGMGYSEGQVPNNQWDTLDYIRDLGFKTSPHNHLARTPKEVEDYYQEWLDRKGKLHYAVDGVVVKVNNFDYQQELGVVGREPRWAVAYKFPSTQAFTRLLDIGINVGRTGGFNPFAILDPVDVGGATVKNATLHNEDDIQRKDIRIGDWVVVERAGEVIPRVVAPVVSRRIGKEQVYTMPATCPVCATPAVRTAGEVMLRCPNIACPAQQLARVKHFVATMEIEGVGGKLVQTLLREKMIQDGADIYSLTKEDLVSLDRMADRSATNVLQSIERSKERPFSQVLFALGILHVGLDVAHKLALHFPSLDLLSSAAVEELTSVPGIGARIAESVAIFFEEKGNHQFIDKIRKAKVRLETGMDEVTGERSLAGIRFVITGRLTELSRSQAEARIKELGGSCSSVVTIKTSFLVVGENPGSKLDQARHLNTQLLSEEELVTLLATGSRRLPANSATVARSQ